MAFEADCGSSTVLEEHCLASTAGFLVPGMLRATGPPRQRRDDDWGSE